MPQYSSDSQGICQIIFVSRETCYIWKGDISQMHSVKIFTSSVGNKIIDAPVLSQSGDGVLMWHVEHVCLN